MDSESFVYYLEKKEFLLTRSSCERYSPKKKKLLSQLWWKFVQLCTPTGQMWASPFMTFDMQAKKCTFGFGLSYLIQFVVCNIVMSIVHYELIKTGLCNKINSLKLNLYLYSNDKPTWLHCWEVMIHLLRINTDFTVSLTISLPSQSEKKRRKALTVASGDLSFRRPAEDSLVNASVSVPVQSHRSEGEPGSLFGRPMGKASLRCAL